MAPMVETFHPARLQQHAQYLPNGKARKPSVELKDCELKELIQYECNLQGPRDSPRSKIVCEPVLKLFRQCANGLTVETTSWEGVHDRVRTRNGIVISTFGGDLEYKM
ncbi:hypothetical protein KC332_g9340 [Hortaea werneckii]|nr:hypothetical protein KC358_g9153 [Hortaea werneckii]KAI6826528.1 hypothetical protein KC350_g8506 [Hortaea werneckii]KAI6923713.1 hypothetical protein KC348_g9451 [Hortaea werneckii]KAI6934856.1 hypothetical protein KC341_g7328 [Hortaea werneckii]KAI6969405.1 hypothetical protein KC321_g7910 [Hortaea werneckii]